ncbi:hypothetical protein [Achromobacter insolitus]|uniref:hypothetical protein n=1 Tax=Achromobacter insolitus TaxID=217204 RepID=UPI0013E36081|nr:hypothetical protein [Achromobacter insolitus]NGT17693.1 hypothetical protein [Achromobacter insolitus]
MQQHQIAVELAASSKSRDFNEADTRHQIIDTVVHSILDWPKSSARLELSVASGYADYVLNNAAGQPALVIEAKREGKYFSLPKPARDAESGTFVTIRTLMTDPAIAAALVQARQYCLDLGCVYGCITNGYEWIVFRVFEVGVDWKALRAYVIPKIEIFSTSFTSIFNSLSYRCVSYDGSLNALLSRSPYENRETYKPSYEIPAYARAIQPNKYVQFLRPIAERFFGVLDESYVEFMDACYVSDREYEAAFKSAQSLLTDALTPYLESYGIRQTDNDEGGGTFGNRLERSVLDRRTKDVVVLFGGKGVGKSTFLRKLLFVRPPQILKKSAVTVIIDLLNVPEEKPIIHNEIWNRLVEALDQDNVLKGSREKLVELFSDRYEVAQQQDMYGFDPTSPDFNRVLNRLIGEWKRDLKYVCAKLVKRLHAQHKGAIVVIDNTDQYGKNFQEYCFTIAHEIADTLNCLAIVSMREERFYASSIRGVLDAYQNSGFHLSAPPPKNVFIKRLDFVGRHLANELNAEKLFGQGISREHRVTLKNLIGSFEREFRNPESHLSSFLTACAHGNIRLALELFRGMLVSRYTNIDEITAVREWTWQIHQVLKPVMIPNRFFYDEGQSHVPNIFQLRSKQRSSHFSALRILAPLARLSELQGTAFHPLSTLYTEFSNRFHMEEDFRDNVDTLLKYGLIDANTRVDEYREDIDGIRITNYGKYVFDDLLSAFTYIELISTDTAIFDSRVSAELAALSLDEYQQWEKSWSDPKKRLERVETRLKKADEFVQYLEAEESREAELYQLTPNERFTLKIRISLDDESEAVRRSASRQRYK